MIGAPPVVDTPPTSRERRLGLRPALKALALFVGLAVAHTWPLASAPGTLSRNDTADTVLHEWILAWVAHQIVRNPLHLFDANIFFPEPDTLAYSDHLFVQSLLGAPLLWAGASPVLVHNLVLLAGLTLTGWVTCLVVTRWTGVWIAGIISGCLVAFNAFTLTRLPQLQDLHLEFFPLCLSALDRLLRSPRTRHALELCLWFVLQALTGTYLMVFTSIALVAAVLARPREWMGSQFRRVVPRLVLAGALATLLLAPFLVPYYRASETVGLGRSLDDTLRYSAEITDYLVAPGTLHFEWLGWGKRFWAGDALFPGITALVLAIVGAFGWRDPRVRMLRVIALVAFALSFGPAFPPYRVLYQVFPLLTGIRGAVRFGQIVLAAIGILAGFGVAAMVYRLRPRLAVPLAAACLIATNLEALRAPLYYSSYSGVPPVYDTLNDISRNAVLAFFPFYGPAQFHQNASFMLVSAKYGFPRMLNGYSGFKPASYYEAVEKLAPFPDAGSIQFLRDQGVTVVLVDGRNMRAGSLANLEKFPELTLIKTDGNLRIYLLSRSTS